MGIQKILQDKVQDVIFHAQCEAKNEGTELTSAHLQDEIDLCIMEMRFETPQAKSIFHGFLRDKVRGEFQELFPKPKSYHYDDKGKMIWD